MNYTATPYTGVVIAEIVSVGRYEAQVTALLDEDERRAMEFFIALTAADHPVIPGTGGFRKARWAKAGGGKSGGYRVIYYFVPAPGRVYLAMIYSKGSVQTISAGDRQSLAKLTALIKASAKENR